ncbi:hypothetical protein OROMI_032316 [Orobanche minor]
MPSQEILNIHDGTPFEMPSQEILKIRDGTPLEWPSQEILKIRDGTHLESGRNFDIQKKALETAVGNFSSKLDVPSNVVQNKRVARILVFKIRPSQEILKIRDGTPLEAEGILTYRKSPRNCSVWHFSSKLDVPSNVVQKKIVAWILVFKIRPSQEILKIRDGTHLEAEGILTYRKKPSKLLEILKIRDVARILVFKIRPSQEILKIRDGTPLEAEGILTYRKRPSQEILKIRDEILKIRDGTHLEWPSQEILKIRDGTPLEAEGILTYRKSPRNCSVWHFSSKLDVPKILKIRDVARILVFKVRPSQEILNIHDGTPFEVEGILTYRKRPSQEILKIRDGTPLE